MISSQPLTASTALLVERECRIVSGVGEEGKVVVALLAQFTGKGCEAGLEALAKALELGVRNSGRF
jgi:hypothetical protein